MLALQTVLLLGAACAVHGLSSGAPQGSCQDMIPKHKVGPQTGPSPYTVQTTAAPNRPGEYVISIKGATFKGFLVQCRTPQNAIIGQFVRVPANAKSVDCNGPNSAVTHASADAKREVSLNWQAPSGYTGQFNCLATVAKDGGTFWVAIPAVKRF